MLLLGGCATPPPLPPPPEAAAPLLRTLTLLHASDCEAEVLPIPGPEGAPSVAGLARFVALAAGLRAREPGPTLLLAAGDLFIPAPALQVELDGKNAVALANNAVGFRASALGNHEFDLGDGVLSDMTALAKYPYVSANVSVAGGPLDELDLEATDLAAGTPWAERSPGKLLPRAKSCTAPLVDGPDGPRCPGLTVGIVGATTETLHSITSVSDDVHVTPSLPLLREAVQRQVDLLGAEGIDIVILLSHLQGVEHELELAEGLSGVDVIVAGGGDDRLAQPGHRLLPGDHPDSTCAATGGGSCYPLRRTGKDGKPLLIVATDGHFRYLGRLGLGFDAAGAIVTVDPASRPWPADDTSLSELKVTTGGEALALQERVRTQIEPLGKPLLRTTHFLNGLRENVRNRETNLGNLAADAILWAASQGTGPGPKAAFALRNGGGIRAPIGAVDPVTLKLIGSAVSELDIRSSLRFDNRLVVVRTTHAALVETLEASLRGAGTGRGRFPQVSAGVELVYSSAEPEQEQTLSPDGVVTGISRPGSRVRELSFVPPGGKRVVVVKAGKLLAPQAKVAFATLSYTVRGGDGWFPGRAGALDVVELPATEQSALRGFLTQLEQSGAWKDGAGYPDPTPEKPESFRRIKRLDRTP